MTESRFYGYKDIAAIFGRTVRTMKNWKKSGDLPEPTKTMAGNPFWEKKAFEKWLAGEDECNSQDTTTTINRSAPANGMNSGHNGIKNAGRW